METTRFVCRIVGPVMLVRCISILIDRAHFVAMVEGLGAEVDTVSFSFFPIALFMACLTLLTLHHDTSSPAAWAIHVMAWGGSLKASALMLFPAAVVAKAQSLVAAGFLDIVCLACVAVGAYFVWFGYARAPGLERE